MNKDSFKKYRLKFFGKKIILLIIFIMIALAIQKPISRYRIIKEYNQYAKENNIKYEFIKCPRCGVKVPDSFQFCHNCNRVLFSNDPKVIQKFDDMNEKISQNVEVMIGVRKYEKTVCYVIIIAIIYKVFKSMLILLQKFVKRYSKK